MRIAICDDEVVIREDLEKRVRSIIPEAHTILYASAEELLLDDYPDILLLDIQMDGMNGMEAAKKLREHSSDTVLIFITAMEVKERFMRITDQMTNRMAEKSGLPIYANRSADSSDNTLLSALNKKKQGSSQISDQYKSQKRKSNFQSLYKSADGLGTLADALATSDNDDKLYGKAAQSGDVSELAGGIERFADSYNNTLSELKDCNSTLNDFYSAEMKKAAEEQRKDFQELGISFDKTGKMSVDLEKLKAVNIEELRKVMEPFAEKVSYLSERISSQAHAEIDSISSRYDATGNLFSSYGNAYDFLG